MGRPVVHFELMSKDPAKVAGFYETIFGWKVTHRPELNYRIFETGAGAGINGGIVKPDKPEPWPGNMVLYIAVDDLDAEIRRLKEQGVPFRNTVEAGPGGKQIQIEDPDGNPIELHEAAER